MAHGILLKLDDAMLAGVDALAADLGVARVHAIRLLIAGGLAEIEESRAAPKKEKFSADVSDDVTF